MASNVLEVRDLTIRYETEEGPLTAVSDASFEVREGDFFGMVGESGCGKTTIAKSIIGGLASNASIDRGEILYDGMDLTRMSEAELNREVRWDEISYIPQSSMNTLDPLMRISDQATEIAKAHSALKRPEIRDRLQDMFETLGIAPERIDDYPHQFSGGMHQRAVIAMALILEPSIVIADEPTTALDVIMQDLVFKHLDVINDEFEMSLMMITHDISLVFESCESMAVMHGGQIAESGTVEDLYDSPRHPYTIKLQGAFPDIENPNKDLDVIAGEPPKNIGEVSACTFASRCPLATEECEKRVPISEPIEDSSDHRVACFHTEGTKGGVIDEPAY